MTFSEKDAEDVRLARPVAITDLWDFDDRVDRLDSLIGRFTDAVERLGKINERLLEFYQQELIRRKELGEEGNDGKCKRKNKSMA